MKYYYPRNPYERQLLQRIRSLEAQVALLRSTLESLMYTASVALSETDTKEER